MESHRELSHSICRVLLVEHGGEHTSPTCVVQGRPSVDRGGPVALDEPLGPRPGLSGPAAERRDVVKVAGEPDVRCNEERRERLELRCLMVVCV